MQRWIQWTVGGFALLAVAAAATFGAGLSLAERKRQRTVAVPPYPIAYTTDPQALARGRYLYETRGCTDCHGLQGTGRSFVQDGKGTHIAGPNITAAGVVAQFRPEDWERAIRHGVTRDGRPLLVMPSEDYHRLTDIDLSALVSYVRSLPPQAGGQARVEFPKPVWVLYGLGLIPDAAGRIDHQLPPAQPVAAGVNAAHGRYIANMCIGCHGAALSGGKIPGGPPDWPPAANLTPGAGSAMVRYPDAARFVAMLRSGQRPDGSAIQVMPFESIGKLNDVDAQALYVYLQTVPAQAAGQR
ncbi:cytochrome C [Acidovorax sp. SRB_14]|uniref:c-type cytochrome n=1 Tax=Acidovorax sp. SRB_14 TaxID=1962699 RepID=UPI001566F547|nr:c-type cytochrome [Acidovorax sp. SRB_14]NMM80098.1 cytochrome C [Acidovorax sp. SRB_14]